MNGQLLVPPSYGFEWWYLHISTHKFSVTLAIHTTELLGGPIEDPYISVTIVGPGRNVFHDRISFRHEKLHWPDGYFTHAGLIAEHRDGWILTLRRPDWTLEGTIRRESDGWRAKGSQLVAGAGGHEMHWAVPMPRGRWHGHLKIRNDTVIDESGYAYQDHNWGDACLASFVHGWSWLALANERATVIWAEVSPLGGLPEQLGIRVDRKGQMTPVDKTPRSVLSRKILVKQREYKKDLEHASYQRSVIRALLPGSTAIGFSECVEVATGFSAAKGTTVVTGHLAYSSLKERAGVKPG